MYILPTMSEHLWVIYGLRLVDDFEYRYVGLTTVGPTLRLQRHIYDSKFDQRLVCRWVSKYSNQIVIDVLEYCPVDDMKYLGEAEQFWISQIRGFGHSLKNLSDGGESGSKGARWKLKDSQIRIGDKAPMFGRRHTEESKDKMSKANLGRGRSESSRKKQSKSISGENHWAFGGGKFSDDHRKKISESRQGTKLSEVTKQKMSDSRKGKTLSEEHKSKISVTTSGSNHHNFGKPAFNRGIPSKSAHTRWHTNRNISKPETCKYCKEKIEQGSN